MMKRRIKIIATLLGIAVLAVPLLACDTERTNKVMAVSPAIAPKETITTTGTGTLSIKPDQATITLGTSTKHDKAAVAAAENAKEIAKIIEAIKKAGLKDEDIETSGYTIGSTYDYSSGAAAFVGYQVSNTLNLKIADINKVAEILDVAVAAGANDVQGVYFSVKDSKEQYAKALEAAIADAKSKAETLAKAAGIKGNLAVYSIRETVSGYMPNVEYSKAAADGAGVETSIMPASQSITAVVSVSFSYN